VVALRVTPAIRNIGATMDQDQRISKMEKDIVALHVAFGKLIEITDIANKIIEKQQIQISRLQTSVERLQQDKEYLREELRRSF